MRSVSSSETGRISLVNSQAEIPTGYSRDQLIDRDIRMVVPDWQLNSLPERAARPMNIVPAGKTRSFQWRSVFVRYWLEEGAADYLGDS